MLVAVNSCVKKDYFVKLNMRIGFLRFRNGSVQFENIAAGKDADKLTKASGDTAFHQNKQLMTNLRERGDESLADAISQITSFRTRASTKPQSSAKVSSLPGADPNQALTGKREKRARVLNQRLDGQDRYSKRMEIQGKDLHADSDLKSMFKHGLDE